jgi:hypothetical protein
LHDAHCDAGVMEKVTASAVCWNVLVVTRPSPEEVAQFVVLSAEPVCRVMLLEPARTSDPPFDSPMVLFKSIVQVDARPVADVAAQRRADCARVGVMPVGCHPVRLNADSRPCRAKEPLGRSLARGVTEPSNPKYRPIVAVEVASFLTIQLSRSHMQSPSSPS